MRLSCRNFSLGFLMVGCVSFCVSCKKQEPNSGQPEPATREVQAYVSESRPMERSITATGTLAARERSVLSSKVSGRLQSLPVDVGSEVRKGELLAQVEPRDYELGLQQAIAALAQSRAAVGLPPGEGGNDIALEQVSTVKQAKAVLEEATKNRDRIRSLSASGIASNSELDMTEAAYEVARTRYETSLEDARSRLATVAQRQAECDLARKRLSDASLRAPFDGVVQSRPANIGEYVTAGMPTVELVQIDPLRLRLQVPERDASLMRLGQLIRLSVEGDTNIYSGQIERLSPALDEQTRMLLVEADVLREGSLRPGLFVRAQIVVAGNEPALSVPEKAVVVFAGIEKVVTVEAGKAKERVITTGRRRDGWVEVTSGLKAGESVVLNPEGLRTGSPVVVKGGSPAEATMPAAAPSPTSGFKSSARILERLHPIAMEAFPALMGRRA